MGGNNDKGGIMEDKVIATKTTLNEFEVNDVFIFESDINNMKIQDFEIIVWFDYIWRIKTQYIGNDWCDYIDYNFWEKNNSVVYKINRF